MGGASLVVWWLRLCLPMQETQVQSLLQEDPTELEATESLHHKLLKPTSLEPVLHKRSYGDEQPSTREQSPLSKSRESPLISVKTQCSQYTDKF